MTFCASLGPMLMFPSVSERYTVDFTPALVLLGATGLYVAGARLHGRRTAQTVVAVLGVVVLGKSRLPEFGRGIGRGIRNFKDSVKEGPEKS